MTTIPDSHRDLLEGPVFLTAITVMADGQPQATVVWGSYDGQYVLLNTLDDSQKARNLCERPKVTVMAIDPDNPYRYMEVRGEVVELTEEGAMDHIDAPAYYGHLIPAEQADKETRLLVKIKPTKVNAISGS